MWEQLVIWSNVLVTTLLGSMTQQPSLASMLHWQQHRRIGSFRSWFQSRSRYRYYELRINKTVSPTLHYCALIAKNVALDAAWQRYAPIWRRMAAVQQPGHHPLRLDRRDATQNLRGERGGNYWGCMLVESRLGLYIALFSSWLFRSLIYNCYLMSLLDWLFRLVWKSSIQ